MIRHITLRYLISWWALVKNIVGRQNGRFVPFDITVQ